MKVATSDEAKFTATIEPYFIIMMNKIWSDYRVSFRINLSIVVKVLIIIRRKGGSRYGIIEKSQRDDGASEASTS
ncbi:MAG: hypothetical protein ACRDCC_07880 [Culicoidibacterales bacterium]